MLTSKYCNENLNASPITWGYAKGELVELIESRTIADIKEEFADVCYCVLCAVHSSTGISLPMVGATPTIKKVNERLSIWRDIFKENGLVFHKKYLVNGSNYKKQHKIDAALAMARAAN
ncbi:MazG nucleotide pyrophosphohydrolase domain-containing protein [Evansella clarkii]|uniref:MazG nucleotide pyrophosphohydrolase domain-containing protein n=1 Tax=Evansella clarkii TaxID=79879 RepID=UPI0009973717|nr:MazG nucleotide pyrophosphohydrolase domain-containing protein [Evansella clarkii]